MAARGVTIALALLALAGPAQAATPAAGTLSDAGAQVRWSGEVRGTVPSPEACPAGTCDEYELTVDLPAGATQTGAAVQVGVHWEDEAHDLELHVYDSAGRPAAQSVGPASTTESVHLPVVNGRYRVVVSPLFTGEGAVVYEGLVEVELPVPVEPVRDLLPNLVALEPRNLTFGTAQYLFDFGLPTNRLSSCYPEETAEQGARRCLRFDQIIANLGDGPFELRYRLDQVATESSLFQRIYRSDGEVRERRADTYEFHATHAHFHYKNFAQSRLWASDAMGRRLGSEPIRVGRKNGFCMIDVEDHWWGRKGDAPRTYTFPRCTAPSEGADGEVSMVNGISRGWADVYNWFLPGQYIEVSGLPDGYYVLETVTDPVDTVVESDERDNLTRSLISIMGDQARLVTPLPAGRPATTRRPRLRVSVTPRRIRAGRRSSLRVTVTVRDGGRQTPVRGARVRAGSGKDRTGRAGRARLVVRPERAGRLVVRASRRGMRDGAGRVRVLSAART